MANHKSAAKRAKISETRRVRNSNYLTSVKTAVKKFQFTINGLAVGTSKDVNQAKAYFREAQSLLQKAASKGIIKKSNAARRIHRLALKLKSLSSKN